jgi:Carboxypeptidase regulatory-like domain/TonB dependent receptor-like, beta-barrel
VADTLGLMRKAYYACLAAVLLLAVGPAAAQTTSATLTGKVATKAGKPVPVAVVQARSDATGAARTTTTDGDGAFRFDLLAPGTWSVVARTPEGVLSDSKSLTLRLQQTGYIELIVGTGLEEEVTVRAEGQLVDPQRTGGELRILGKQADDLPLSGRNAVDLALLDSSVRQAAPSSYYGERAAPFVVNGQTGRSNSYLVDGLDNNDIASGTSLNASFSDLVISEFVVLTHQFAPEFGRASGGILNIITERGANTPEMLGFAQGSLRGLNSSGDLVDALPATPGVSATGSNWSAGLRCGGPIKKDKAFWFAAFEHQSQSTIIPFTGTGADRIAGGRYDAPSSDDNAFFRTDVNIDPANTLMVRLSYDSRSNEGVNVGGVATPSFGFKLGERDLQLGASLTTVMSPSLIHEIRVLASTSSFEQSANSSLSGVERPSGEFGGNNLNHQTRDATQFQLVQNLTWVSGRHTTKFGYDVTPSHTRVAARFNPNGNFIYRTDHPFQPGDCGGITFFDLPLVCSDDHTFSCNLESDACPGLGKGHCEPNYDDPVPSPCTPGVDDNGDGQIDEPALPKTYPLIFELIEGSPKSTLDDTEIAAFAQDSWQPSSSWVLDFGLRYDLDTYTLPKSASVRSTIPNGGAGRDTNNLAPRFGFTYTAGKNRDWVVRGGAGVFYNKTVLAFPAVAAITSNTQIGLIFPQGFLFELTEEAIAQYGIDAIKPGLMFPDSLVLRFSTGTRLDSTQANLFNLGFEKGVRDKGVFSVNATRALTYHVPLMRDLNPVVGKTLDGIPIHRDSTTGSIAAVTTDGRAWYTGVDVGWKWQDALGWYSVSYTWSKSVDTGPDPLKGGIYLPPNSDDISSERGPSDNDRRHRFVVAGDLGLGLGGLRISGVYQFASAIPFNVTTGTDDNLDGITSDRPPGIGRNTGTNTPLGPINAYRADNGLPPVQSLTAPTLSQLDLKLYRPFAAKQGKLGGQAFVQIFNVLNRYNGGLVEGRVLASNFGKVISYAGPPRTVELGLKLGF